MFRIERGRARTKATKISVASVAREAGISTSLIHNHYPSIAEAIREVQGRSSRAQRDAKTEELKVEREKNKSLRQEVETLRGRIERLASINEVLIAENLVLKATAKDSKVIPLKK